MERSSGPELSVIIVSWNAYDLVVDCVNSLEQTIRSCSYEVLVCDNSQDETGRAAWLGSHLTSVKWIFNDRNVGFAAGNNQAIQLAQGQLIMLLNPDCIALPGAIDSMVSRMRHERSFGILGCQLINGDGSRQTSSYNVYPSLVGAVLDITGWLVISRWYSARQVMRESLSEVAWVKGACLLIRRAAADVIGPLDDSFFLYSEDADWCFRARQTGWRVGIVRDAFVLHHGQQSAGLNRVASIAAYYDAYRRFILKHGGRGTLRWRAVACSALLGLAAGSRLLGSAALALQRPNDWSRVTAYFRYLIARQRHHFD